MVPSRWVGVRTAHAVRRPSVAQGVKFTDNVVADPDLSHAVQGATLLIFVLPHQVACTAPGAPARPRDQGACTGAGAGAGAGTGGREPG